MMRKDLEISEVPEAWREAEAMLEKLEREHRSVERIVRSFGGNKVEARWITAFLLTTWGNEWGEDEVTFYCLRYSEICEEDHGTDWISRRMLGLDDETLTARLLGANSQDREPT